MKRFVTYAFDFDTEYQAYCSLCDVLKMLKIHFITYRDIVNNEYDSASEIRFVEFGDDKDVL